MAGYLEIKHYLQISTVYYGVIMMIIREDIMIFDIICLGNAINPGIYSIVMHNGYYSVSNSILHNTMRSLL